MAENTKLFQPVTIGTSELSNRIAMAPLTRFRATDNYEPTDTMATYYAQRAAVPGTLILTEATYPSHRAAGYANVPGLWTPAQLAGWRKTTEAVHARGGKIWVQIWALGRVAQPDAKSKAPARDPGFDYSAGLVSSSDVPAGPGYPAPRPLSEDEIWGFVQDFATGAKNAVEVAGFDGVEIHGAHGYLVDQFTQDTANKRTDKWGGSIENRARFAVEVCKAVAAAVGPSRVGIRLSPWNTVQGMRMADPRPQFTHLITQLAALDLAYLHLVEPRVHGVFDKDPPADENLEFALDAWGRGKKVLIAGGYTPEQAVDAVERTYSDWDAVIVFGRRFISTPDLVYRIKKGIEWAQYDRSSFYYDHTGGAPITKGYIDYPVSKEYVQEFEQLYTAPVARL